MVRNIQKQFQEITYENAKFNEIQKLVYNFCSLVNHLQIQDEIDKQNISLMGIN